MTTTAVRLPSLFELGDAESWLLSMVDSESHLEPEDIERARTELVLIDQMMLDKTEGYVAVIRSLEAMAEARKAEADRLRDRARQAQKHADWLRNRLLVHMASTDRPRIETPKFTVTIRQNPVHIDVIDEPVLARVEAYETMPNVPPQFVRLIQLYKVDRRAIADQVKATGESVDGVVFSRSQRLVVT